MQTMYKRAQLEVRWKNMWQILSKLDNTDILYLEEDEKGKFVKYGTINSNQLRQ